MTMNKLIKKELFNKLGWNEPNYGWSEEKSLVSDALLQVQKNTRKEIREKIKTFAKLHLINNEYAVKELLKQL